ncbi:MAG: YceI family protein [bacterium]|nr:YceI family protein [bacterium]
MSIRKTMIAAICLLVMGLWIPVRAGTPEGLTSKNVSATITINGTSTVRDWSCKGPAYVEVVRSNGAEEVPGLGGGIESVRITVGIDNLDCENGNKKMNEHMRKALKAKDHPEIIYSMTKYSVQDSVTIHVRGGLSIGGVILPADLTAVLKAINGNGVRANGETEINMEDFSLKPPSLFLGTVKVDPKVRVKFSVDITPTDATTNALHVLQNPGQAQ